MSFQLVLATESEITVWHTDLGHIYGFVLDPESRALAVRFTRDCPDAEQRAAALQDDAQSFAIGLARDRHMLG